MELSSVDSFGKATEDQLVAATRKLPWQEAKETLRGFASENLLL